MIGHNHKRLRLLDLTLRSLPGQYGLFLLNGGGRVRSDPRHSCTSSDPILSAVSILLNPVSAPYILPNKTK